MLREWQEADSSVVILGSSGVVEVASSDSPVLSAGAHCTLRADQLEELLIGLTLKMNNLRLGGGRPLPGRFSLADGGEPCRSSSVLI